MPPSGPEWYAVPKKITPELSGRSVGRAASLEKCIDPLGLSMGRRYRNQNFSNTQARTRHNPLGRNGLFTGSRDLGFLLLTAYVQNRACGWFLPYPRSVQISAWRKGGIGNGRFLASSNQRAGRTGRPSRSRATRHTLSKCKSQRVEFRDGRWTCGMEWNDSTRAPCLCGWFTQTTSCLTLWCSAPDPKCVRASGLQHGASCETF